MLTTTAGSAYAYQTVTDIGARQIAIATLRVLDEDATTPVALSGRLSTGDARVTVLAKSDGYVALVGVPELALANPGSPPTFAIDLAEPGFRPARRMVVLPPNPSLPLSLPDLVLRRLPRTLAGRVVDAASGAPVAAATITLAPNPSVAGRHLVTLRQPLASDVPAGTPVQGFALVPVPAVPPTSVRGTVPAGGTWLEVGDRTGFAAGQILQIGPPDRQTLARVTFVSPLPAPVTLPGLVLLATPLTATARHGDAALPFTLAAASAAVQTVGAAFSGESVLITDAAPAGVVLIVGAPATGAPHLRPAASDADGYYRLGGIARIPRFTITVNAAGYASQTRAWIPGAGTTGIDWRLLP